MRRAARSSAHPAPSVTRAPRCPPVSRVRKSSEPSPGGERDAGHQPQPSDLAIACLTQKLELEQTLRTLPFGIDLLALQLEPPAVPIEHFPTERGDDDATSCLLHRREPVAPACGA